jgi:hypothetical protein
MHRPVASAKSETVNQTLGEPIKRKLRQAESALGTPGRSRVANARIQCVQIVAVSGTALNTLTTEFIVPEVSSSLLRATPTTDA